MIDNNSQEYDNNRDVDLPREKEPVDDWHNDERSNGDNGFNNSRGNFERSPGNYERKKNYDRTQPEPCECIGVFGLSYRTTERELKDIFKKCGPIDDCTVIADRKTGKSRGFGFIRFREQEDADRARKEMNGAEIDGRIIRVDYSVTQRPHSPTPGRYMGRRTTSSSYMSGNYRGGSDDDYRGRRSGSHRSGARRYDDRDDYHRSRRNDRSDRNDRNDRGGGGRRRSESQDSSPSHSPRRHHRSSSHKRSRHHSSSDDNNYRSKHY